MTYDTFGSASDELEYLRKLEFKLNDLCKFLASRDIPTHPTAPEDWFIYLSQIKKLVRNASNDLSFVAALMAKGYLYSKLAMVPFDVGTKPQGAAGLDIDEQTTDGRRVVAEIKTTTPYKIKDFGSNQKVAFTKDFAKLNAAEAQLKFLFVTDSLAFTLLSTVYRKSIPSVTIVLLPEGTESKPIA